MKLSDFGDETMGYCATAMKDGKEVILSQCMIDGTLGVGRALDKMATQLREIPTIQVRWGMLQRGIELEATTGMQLTGKTSSSSALIKREFGISKGLSKVKTGVAFNLLLNLLSLKLQELQEEEEE